MAPLFEFKTEYGLASYFYARDVGRVFKVAEALEAGIVSVNDGIFSTEVAPFGGYKHSGIGREGSKYGIDEYLEIKYVNLGGIEQPGAKVLLEMAGRRARPFPFSLASTTRRRYCFVEG